MKLALGIIGAIVTFMVAATILVVVIHFTAKIVGCVIDYFD